MTLPPSPAGSPPATTGVRPTVVAPAPLVGMGRSASWLQVLLVGSRQSTRAVLGARPPATQTAPFWAKPATWWRGRGRGGSSCQRSPSREYAEADARPPAYPPVRYRRPSRAAAEG